MKAKIQDTAQPFEPNNYPNTNYVFKTFTNKSGKWGPHEYIEKAFEGLEKYVNEHNSIIVNVFKRRTYISNAGNGDEYYELDAILINRK